MHMKIVVLGGAGLIGSKTVAILRTGGHEAVAASPKTGMILHHCITGTNISPHPRPPTSEHQAQLLYIPAVDTPSEFIHRPRIHIVASAYTFPRRASPLAALFSFTHTP